MLSSLTAGEVEVLVKAEAVTEGVTEMVGVGPEETEPPACVAVAGMVCVRCGSEGAGRESDRGTTCRSEPGGAHNLFA